MKNMFIKLAIVISVFVLYGQSLINTPVGNDDYYVEDASPDYVEIASPDDVETASPDDQKIKASPATFQPSTIANQWAFKETTGPASVAEVVKSEKEEMVLEIFPEDKEYQRIDSQIESSGEALFLTPYIESGDISEAVRLANVTGLETPFFVESYSGFLSVDKRNGNTVFFWFFPALSKETSSPLIVWLEGEPGRSALYAIFNIHGPYKLDEHLKIDKRPYTWTENFNILYLDSRVGTGFSFTNRSSGYPTSHDHVSDYLYRALKQFFTMFPRYKENHVYVCGEGYGAKLAVSLSNKIHVQIEPSVMDFKGTVLGNPYLDQEVMTPQARYLFELGFLDDEGFLGVNNLLHQAKLKIQKNAWSEAMDKIEEVFGSPYKRSSDSNYYIPRMTGLPRELDFLEDDLDHLNRYVTFINQSHVRRAIHVGNQPFQDGRLSYEAMRQDIPQSVKSLLSTVLNNYRVLFYGGNMNLRCPYSLSVGILERVRWNRLTEFKNSTRMIWKVDLNDREVAGYVRHVKNFYEVMVRNSGGMVAKDQPRAALDMMKRFIWGRAFNIEEY